MSKNKLVMLATLCFSFIQTGCYTTLHINLKNDTGQKINVKDMQTAQEVQINQGDFKRMVHDQASLIVTTPDKQRYIFSGVEVVSPEMDPKYYNSKNGVFGAWSTDLNLILQTNMALYVLLPGKKSIDAEVSQPNGYPKTGIKIP